MTQREKNWKTVALTFGGITTILIAIFAGTYARGHFEGGVDEAFRELDRRVTYIETNQIRRIDQLSERVSRIEGMLRSIMEHWNIPNKENTDE